MQLHPVIETYADRYELDPRTGSKRRVRETILDHAGTESVQHDGRTYYPDAFGTFNMPDEVASQFVNRTMGNIVWREGPSPFAVEAEMPSAPTMSTPRKRTR